VASPRRSPSCKKIIQSPADNFVAEGYTPVPRIIGVAGDFHF
jgi:hypothetical protein